MGIIKKMTNYGLVLSLILILPSMKSEEPKGITTYKKNAVLTHPSDSTGYDAVLSTTHSFSIGRHNAILPFLNLSIAYFYDHEDGVPFDESHFLRVSSVTINDSALTLYSPAYVDTSFIAYPSPVTWKVISQPSSFPTFTFTNTNDFPDYSGFDLLPDTVFANQDISFNISNYSNTDKVEIMLQNGDNNQSIQRSIDSTGIETFTQSDLSGILSQNTMLRVVICLSNFNTQNISGKKVMFINNYNVFKNLILVTPNNNSRKVNK